MRTGEICPVCGEELAGLGTYCFLCERYTDEGATTDATPEARTKRKDDRPESEIRMAIRAVLEAHGFTVLDFEQGYRKDGSTRVRKGLPDLYVMGYGVGVWRELKSAKGRLTPEQKEFGEECARRGISWDVWRHEDEAIEWALTVKKNP